MAIQPQPDDECALCGLTRENHGDSNHKFSQDGELIPVKPGPPARQQPPEEKKASLSAPAKDLAEDTTAQAFLRLVDVLVKKEVLDGQDLMYILGNHVSH